MILIVIVIIDCNIKMFSKMLEGQSSEDPPKNNIPIRCPNTYTYPKIQILLMLLNKIVHINQLNLNKK